MPQDMPPHSVPHCLSVQSGRQQVLPSQTFPSAQQASPHKTVGQVHWPASQTKFGSQVPQDP